MTVRAALLPGLALVVTLAGCSGGPPKVEFSSAAGTVSADPAQYCDLAVTECENKPEALVHLVVPAGQPLTVKVPSEVSEGLWHVVFAYRAEDGTEQTARSDLFRPGERPDYTLVLPNPTDQLLTAQVQQFGGAKPATGPDGAQSFAIRGSWVLNNG